MTRLVFGVAIAFPLMAQQFHVDHVTVAGKNVAAMQEALREAGIKSEYGGPHSNHATEMALASFPDGSYLELIAIQPQADPMALAAHEWHEFLESDAGPCAWAIRPENVGAEVQRLRAAGIAVTDPSRSGRKRPDGVELDWETSRIGPTRGGFFPFMIHDFTPRDNRAFPSGKPTTTKWAGIVNVVIGVRDFADAIVRYRRAYELPAPIIERNAAFGARVVLFPGTPIVLASPLSQHSWLSERLNRFGEAPCAFVLGTQPTRTLDKISWAPEDRLGWHLGFEQ
jgi:hypothetical protein